MHLATTIGKEPIEVSPVWFVVRRQTVYFPIDPTIGDPGRSATPASRHLPALEGGGMLSAVIDDGAELTNSRGVQLSGRAAKVEQGGLKDDLLELALEKYFYVGHAHLEHYLSTGVIEARQWFRIDADRIVGWDRRLLPQAPIISRRVLPKHLRTGKR